MAEGKLAGHVKAKLGTTKKQIQLVISVGLETLDFQIARLVLLPHIQAAYIDLGIKYKNFVMKIPCPNLFM